MRCFNPDKVDTSDFEFRNISADELQGMFDTARHILNKFRSESTKTERRAARYLLKAAMWIEREAYYTAKRNAN